MSGLRGTRRARVGINRYPGRGRRERWNGRCQVSAEMPGAWNVAGSQVPEPRLAKYSRWRGQVCRSWVAPVGTWTTLKDIPGVGQEKRGLELGLRREMSEMG